MLSFFRNRRALKTEECFSWTLVLLFLLCSQAGVAVDPLADCSQNSGNQPGDCDFNKNYLEEPSCHCIPCRQSKSFCHQIQQTDSKIVAADSVLVFWSRRCKDWEKKGFCKDLFLPQPTTIAPVATGGTTAGNTVRVAVPPSVYAANASTRIYKTAAASKATGSVPRESGSTISNEDSRLKIALPVVTFLLVIALALLIVYSFIIYYRGKRNNQEQGSATPENHRRQQFPLIEIPEQIAFTRNSYGEQYGFHNEEDSSFSHPDRQIRFPSFEPNTDSFASMRAYSTIPVDEAAIAQVDVHFREHRDDSGSTDSVLFSPEQDVPVLGSSHDPSEDLNSRPILNQSGENQVDSVPQRCCVNVEPPAPPEIEKAFPVRATQTSDPHQIREPPTSAENLPLLRRAVSA